MYQPFGREKESDLNYYYTNYECKADQYRDCYRCSSGSFQLVRHSEERMDVQVPHYSTMEEAACTASPLDAYY